MPTLFLSHEDCEKHVMLAHHPESPARLRSIKNAVAGRDWGGRLSPTEAREISRHDLEGIHPGEYLEMARLVEGGQLGTLYIISLPHGDQHSALELSLVPHGIRDCSAGHRDTSDISVFSPLWRDRQEDEELRVSRGQFLSV